MKLHKKFYESNSTESSKKSHYPIKTNDDDFWDDCIDYNEKRKKVKQFSSTSSTRNKNSKLKSSYSAKNINLGIPKGNFTNNNNKKQMLKSIKNVDNNKNSSLYGDMEIIEEKNSKSKNALIRCLGLYAYGIEIKKYAEENNKKFNQKKMKEELSTCTFKPKLNKRTKEQEEKINALGKNIYIRDKFRKQKKIKEKENKNKNSIEKKKKNIVNKSVDIGGNPNELNESKEECTFKPHLNGPLSTKKMFNKSKPIIESKENAEFILRYAKARDEYMIRKFLKLPNKDDSYESTLLALTSRMCNKQYKDYLNVNYSIPLFGSSISKNGYIYSSLGDFKGVQITDPKPIQRKNSQENYIGGLRRNLLNISINEIEED